MDQIILRFIKDRPKHTRIKVDFDAESVPVEIIVKALRDLADELEEQEFEAETEGSLLDRMEACRN